MDLLELADIYKRSNKPSAVQFNEYSKIHYKQCKKRKKKKKTAQIFSILKHVIESFKKSKFYY
jgi:protein tyrosine/serine phosphatase